MTASGICRYTRKSSALLLAIFAASLFVGGCEVRQRNAEQTDFDSEAAQAESPEAVEEDPPAPAPGDDRSVAERLEDAALAARVKISLVEERQLRRFDIETEAQEGLVVLRGELPSAEHHALAERVARGVEGVRQVRNEVEAPEVQAPAAVDTPDVPAGTASDTGAAQDAPAERATDAQASTDSEEQEASSSAEYYTVRSGDSLWEIARKNNTSVEAIRRLNNLPGDRLQPGQRIRVR